MLFVLFVNKCLLSKDELLVASTRQHEKDQNESLLMFKHVQVYFHEYKLLAKIDIDFKKISLNFDCIFVGSLPYIACELRGSILCKLPFAHSHDMYNISSHANTPLHDMNA